MTREKIDVHHHCAVIHLSTSLMMVKGLSAIFAKHPTMTATITR